jgi:phosphoglucosamine mutase
MTVFPQVLINIDVSHKPPLDSLPEIQTAIRNVEKELAGKGRVLVRYSRMQPRCRVMVEGPTIQESQDFCNWIASEVKSEIGNKP